MIYPWISWEIGQRWGGGVVQGVTKSVVFLGWPITPSYMSPNAGGIKVGGVSANEYSCTHGAQINFGDLTPYSKTMGGCVTPALHRPLSTAGSVQIFKDDVNDFPLHLILAHDCVSFHKKKTNFWKFMTPLDLFSKKFPNTFAWKRYCM